MAHFIKYFFLNSSLHYTNFFFRIFFILNSSSSLTIYDEDCESVIHWKEKRSIAADQSITEWNTLWISDSVFRQKKCELIFLTMMYLTFFTLNFLHSQSVCMFLRFSQILSSFLKLYNCCLFQLIIFFCICWATVMIICAHSMAFFIFWTIWFAFCTELFADCMGLSFSNNYKNFMWYLWDKKKRLTSVKAELWLLIMSSVMRSRFAQLSWL